MVKVCATTGGVATAKRLGPYMLTVPAIPLVHGSGVVGVKKNYLSVAILAVGLIGFVVAIVVCCYIGVGGGHKSV